MDPREIETLIQRLVANPHDQEALAYAHHAGSADPRSYAILLEKVGQATQDPAYAAHWLSEAANVWSTTIGDAHHAARTLMAAIEKDPTASTPAQRLSQLYRDKGDVKALVALLERLVKSITPLVHERPDVRPQLIAMHEELGRLWSEPPLGRAERAIENWRRVAELDPQNAYAIYAAREMLKAAQQWAEAVPYFAMEQALVSDLERNLALYRDEADVRKRAGDGQGSSHAIRLARQILSTSPHGAPGSNEDLALRQELGLSIVERVEGGEPVGAAEREEAAQIFVTLAETYDGAYGMSYSVSALKAQPGNDRAMQLADFYAGQLGRTSELGAQYAAYLQANPNGFMGEVARAKAALAPPPPPVQAPPPPVTPQPAAAAELPNRTPTPFPGMAVQTPGAAASAQASPQAASQTPSPTASPAEVEHRPSTNPGDLQQILDEAQSESQKGKKPQAYTKFREALKIDPAQPEALSWVEDYLRQKRMFADLRDVLLGATRATNVSPETRKAQLRDVAGICESQLRDMETAIQAWKQICSIDRADEQARDQLRRLLEKGARWDDLAMLLEQEAMGAADTEEKITLEKKLATLHEQKRKDPAAAAEAWARIANLSPQDETAIQTAVKLYEKGERFDLAAQVLSDNVGGIEDKNTRSTLFHKLGDLRTKTNDLAGAGDAFSEAAQLSGQAKLWELAEKAFVAAGKFGDAANAVDQRAQSVDGKARSALYAQAADLLLKADDPSGAITKLEQAAELEPTNDALAQQLEEQYTKAEREPDLVHFLLTRAEQLSDKGRRVAARRSAATLQRKLGDHEGTRSTLLLVLNDGDDAAALSDLVDDANQRGDHQEAVGFLRRLGALAKTPEEKVQSALKEAAMLADQLDDTEAALARYESIVKDLDPKNRQALHAIADLCERRDDPKGVASAIERELPLAEGEEKVELAQRLAQLYEGPLQDLKGAIRALDIVHAADPEDFDAIARLQRLSEQVEDWPRVATLMQALIDVEGDEEEASRMTVHLSGILADKLGRGDEALSALEKLADQGDAACRDAYTALGDKLGWKGIVATKLVAWHESGVGPGRNEALRSAFERFLEIGRDQDAARVGTELARSRGADRELATKLEEIATRLRDLEALAIAHDLLAKELSGPARASELVRQAEAQVAAGVDPLEAMQHGESALGTVPPAEVEPLLARLAALTHAPGHVIDLYERQVGRCRVPADRLTALARAAQVAAERGANDRARSFFELALGGGVQEDTLTALEAAARTGDERAGGHALRATLAEALAAGGQGSRDGGRTRGALLRRAATIAHRDLNDVDKAFGWLGDALITHVEDVSLDALEALGRELGAVPRVEATLSRALEEVFDGPLVRKLVQRRAHLRRDLLGDPKGAAVDLKKLHDLSPSDQDVMNELSSLLLQLGDHRGMVQLYEDQILRGRDPAQRAELARKVARIWEEDLADAREAADAWRRVLRMKAGDAEATAGLDRAKTGKLKRASSMSLSIPAGALSAAPPSIRPPSGGMAAIPSPSMPPPMVASPSMPMPSMPPMVAPPSMPPMVAPPPMPEAQLPAHEHLAHEQPGLQGAQAGAPDAYGHAAPVAPPAMVTPASHGAQDGAPPISQAPPTAPSGAIPPAFVDSASGHAHASPHVLDLDAATIDHSPTQETLPGHPEHEPHPSPAASAVSEGHEQHAAPHAGSPLWAHEGSETISDVNAPPAHPPGAHHAAVHDPISDAEEIADVDDAELLEDDTAQHAVPGHEG